MTPTTTSPPGDHAVLPSPTVVPEPIASPCGQLLPLAPVRADPAVRSLAPVLSLPPSVPEGARPALDYLLDDPGSVGLAAYEIGRESDGLFLNPDQPMPLASVVKIVNLIAYAEAVDAGQLDPASWVPLEELDRFYLPGSDLGAHARSLASLRERNLVGREPPATPLEEVADIMIRFSSNAAADYLHWVLGQEAIEKTVLNLGLASQTAPCPWLGQFLVMSNRSRPGNDRQAVQAYIDDPVSYGQEVMRLTNAFANDQAFRDAERSPRWQRLPIQTQALFADNLNAQGSARDYADLMARIAQNQLGSSYVNILVRRVLEWPAAFPANLELFSTVGYKDGSLPGVLTTVYYAQRLADGKQVVVALFFRGLPNQTYQSWRRNLAHDELARWLISDPEAIPALQALLQGL